LSSPAYRLQQALLAGESAGKAVGHAAEAAGPGLDRFAGNLRIVSSPFSLTRSTSPGEWTVELKLSGRIIPVLNISPPVPRERGTHLGFDGMLNLVDDVIHD
jgi:hypothetical protein